MRTIEQPLSLSTWNLVSPLSQLSNRKPRIWKHQKTFLISIWQLTDIPCKGGWGGGMWKWHRCICSATRGVSHRRTWERKLWGSSVIGDDCNYTKQPEINVGRRTNKTTCPLPPSCESRSCSPSGSSPVKLSESVATSKIWSTWPIPWRAIGVKMFVAKQKTKIEQISKLKL